MRKISTGILVTVVCLGGAEDEDGVDGVLKSSSSSELRTISPSSSTGRNFPFGAVVEPGNEFRPMES